MRDKLNVWKQLQKHATHLSSESISSLFSENINRADEFSLEAEGIFLDYSKNLLDSDSLSFLFSLARDCELENAIEALFSGKKINFTERKEVLHVALRNQECSFPIQGNRDIMPEISGVLERMRCFSSSLHGGSYRGSTGKKITHVVNLGIGGSHLGPQMAVNALSYYSLGIEVSFIANLDGIALNENLKKIDPETSLFLIASKTFTTLETMTNAMVVRDWLTENLGENAIAQHMVALSTNVGKVKEFGISVENMFPFWDWVGGRYSLCSAIGLSLMIAIGAKRFDDLLVGLYSMDQHFRSAPFEKNLPLILALIGIWQSNFLGMPTHAVIPYSESLSFFPAYLQQTDMESNGKQVNKHGEIVSYETGPIIWGEVGTNSQHSFFQWLHQGTSIVPCDFIGFVKPLVSKREQHEKLMSNFFAQQAALAFGTVKPIDKADISIASFRQFPGNRPSNSLLFSQLTPKNLGKLISIYEHKIFCQGIIWEINSFDQWGVELGKKMSGDILPSILNGHRIGDYDVSTNMQIDYYLKHQ